MTNIRFLTILFAGAIALGGCRHTSSEKPPVHISPNMDFQQRFDPQEAISKDMFADGRAMRPPVAGTVARGFLREDSRFYFGREANGELVASAPIAVTTEVVNRGRDRYDIFCAPCHGLAGDGLGPVMTGKYGFVPAPSYHTDVMRSNTDGHYYEVITNGIRTMMGYGQQIPVADRWAIVTYIRALQLGQSATSADVPESEMARIAQ